MSHTVKLILIADQVIDIQGIEVNVHDIYSIIVDPYGKIINASVDTHNPQVVWILKEEGR